MNKLIGCCLLIAVICIGCEGFNAGARYETVRQKYKDGEVVAIPGESYRFLVKTKQNDIIYIETKNVTNTDITTEYIAFRGNGN